MTTGDATNGQMSHAVLTAVADAEGVDPIDLDRPLYEAIDPDALDSLFRPDGTPRTDGRVRFSYYGYEITVHADGRLELTAA